MRAIDWLRRLDVVLAAAEICDGEPATLRDLTFGVYRLLETGDFRVQNAFQDLAEAEIAAFAKTWGEALSGSRFTRPEAPADLPHGVKLAAQLLRGLEAALMGLGSQGWGQPKAASLKASFGQEHGWILPFAPRFREPFDKAQPYFRKRGLQHHRCLPEQLPDGLLIDLKIIDSGFDDPISAACCLFTGLVLLGPDGKPIVANGGRFQVDGLEGRDPAEIADALAKACGSAEKPELVLFPELGIRPEDRQEIQTLLRTAPWDPDLNGHRPQLVFAGSWHDVIAEGDYAGRRQNCAPVYDGDGVAIARHVKHEPYVGDGLTEDIVPGESILVLASRSLTVAVAVCLDFCQEGRANTYEHIDADLVAVISYGNDATTEGHRRRSEQIWHSRKTGTVLVQQDDHAPFGVTGASPDKRPFDRVADTAVVIRKISSPG